MDFLRRAFGITETVKTAPRTVETVRRVEGAVFRVKGIPLTAKTEDLEAALSSAFLSEGITLDTSQTTICPSCCDQKSKTALLQFTPHPPHVLDNLSNGDTYEVEFKNPPCDISIDRDFYGLTQVYPTQGKIKADIVAVPGLNSHAYGSWRGRGNRRKMWLRHFLPEDFPNCRTMIYGYNSRLESHATHTTLDYAKTFLEELIKARQSQEENRRPIVFIGHGFGGIVIAQSLIRAREVSDIMLFMSTRATIFFGTPHRGLVVDDMLAMLGQNSPRAALVNSIQKQAELLEYELSRFIEYSTTFKIVSFSETSQTKKLKQGPDGRWSRSGDYFTAVEGKSSVLQLPSAIEKSLSIEGDHSAMVKFQHRENSSYTSVVRYIKNFLSEGDAATSIGNYLRVFDDVLEKSTDDLREVSQGPSTTESHKKNTITLLHAAASGGDEVAISILLERQVDIEAVDEMGNTALHLAARNGNEGVIEMLLKSGAGIAVNCEGVTALHLAAQCGHAEAVEVLLVSGDTAVTKDGYTALHLAVKNGHGGVAEVLLKNGADITATGKNKCTPLHLAVQYGYEGMVEMLLRNGADIEAVMGPHKYTPLHIAAEHGYEKVVGVLLKNGSDIEALMGQHKYTPLHLAAEHGYEKVVGVLLKNGADIEALMGQHKHTPLHIAAYFGKVKVVDMLLKNGSDIEALMGQHKYTPLHLAAEHGYEKVVEVLLENRADTNALMGQDKYTPLHVAARHGHEKVVDVLLRGGADITATTANGYVVLRIAHEAEHGNVVEVLLTDRVAAG